MRSQVRALYRPILFFLDHGLEFHVLWAIACGDGGAMSWSRGLMMINRVFPKQTRSDVVCRRCGKSIGGAHAEIDVTLQPRGERMFAGSTRRSVKLCSACMIAMATWIQDGVPWGKS
jgi:hypothetical protein